MINQKQKTMNFKPNRNSQHTSDIDYGGSNLIANYMKLYESGIFRPTDGFTLLSYAIDNSSDHASDVTFNKNAKSVATKAIETLAPCPFYTVEEFMSEVAKEGTIMLGEVNLRLGDFTQYKVSIDDLPPSLCNMVHNLPSEEKSDFLMGFLMYMVPIVSKTTGSFQYKDVTTNLNAVILQDRIKSKSLMKKIKSNLSKLNRTGSKTIEIAKPFDENSANNWTKTFDDNFNSTDIHGFNSYIFQPSEFDTDSLSLIANGDMLDYQIVVNSCNTSFKKLYSAPLDHEETEGFNNAFSKYLRKIEYYFEIRRPDTSKFEMSTKQHEAFINTWNETSRSWVHYYGLEVKELALSTSEIAYKLCMIISVLRQIDDYEFSKEMPKAIRCTDADIKIANELAVSAFFNSLQLKRQYGEKDYLQYLTNITLSKIGEKTFYPEDFIDIYTKYGGGIVDASYIINLDPYEIFIEDSDGVFTLRETTYKPLKLDYAKKVENTCHQRSGDEAERFSQDCAKLDQKRIAYADLHEWKDREN